MFFKNAKGKGYFNILSFLSFMFIHSFHLSMSWYPPPQSPSGPIPLPEPLLLGCGYRRMFITERLKKCQHALLHAGRGHFGRCVSLVSRWEAGAIHGVGSSNFGACPPHFGPHRRCLCNQALLVLDLKGAPDIWFCTEFCIDAMKLWIKCGIFYELCRVKVK